MYLDISGHFEFSILILDMFNIINISKSTLFKNIITYVISGYRHCVISQNNNNIEEKNPIPHEWALINKIVRGLITL